MAHRLKLRNDDFDVIGAVPRDLSVIKNFLKRDCAVKRLIDIEEEFLQQCIERGEDPVRRRSKEKEDDIVKRSSLQGSAVPEPKPDGCASQTPAGATAPDYCDPCRRLPTSVVLEELTKPAMTNPVFNKALPPYFDEESVMGNSLPVKFRFRRKFNSCDQEKSGNLMCTTTPSTNVVVLTNCCDVMVWPGQRVAQMNRVPVTIVTGEADLTEYMLEEETIM
ncbi:uncharacterized protein Dana_GF12970 [Drosophila ananassae]|uniref:Uncharacterized protein n=1 Tax=Drosophila ananassae TaxID=7217 RepID=B3MDS9_DROAN|nr:uncharacterized protein LOC6495814 [Drosophila ananassae]EDV36464.1 uncharacterized protein Dana_GF12970 [Drosophila ananassae]